MRLKPMVSVSQSAFESPLFSYPFPARHVRIRSMITSPGFRLIVASLFAAFTCSVAAQSNPTPQSPTAFDQVLSLITQSQQKFSAGQTAEAISLAERAVQLGEKELGTEHGAVA